ncbi:MAG: hypothetical protein IJZ34_15940 [Lachnospiraceae bacterium]|nr:hypothetical protein [Lachnospiraceae bacterium]
MKNIFVEGIQGMGKSTLLRSISAEIPELHICWEGDYSPIDLAWCTWMTKEEYDQLLKAYESIREEIIKNTVKEDDKYIVSYTKIITDIPNFHREAEKFEIYNGRKSLQELKEIVISRYQKFSENGYLFECSFFQNIIEDLILFHQLSDDEIVEFYRELYGSINKEQFLLLYLYSDQLEETIKIIRKERSDNQGNEIWYPLMLEYLIHSPYGMQHGYKDFQDMIAHFKHRQQLELRIISEIVGESAMILPAKNWKVQEVITLIT